MCRLRVGGSRRTTRALCSSTIRTTGDLDKDREIELAAVRGRSGCVPRVGHVVAVDRGEFRVSACRLRATVEVLRRYGVVP
jgi:hypothetical protein